MHISIQKDEYIEIIKQAGFAEIKVQKEKSITLPDNLLRRFLSDDEVHQFHQRESGIFSLTVYAEKSKGCCGPACCN